MFANFINAQKKENTGKATPMRQEIIDSCESPADALNILSTESLFKQLSFEDILNTARVHPELVALMFTKNEFLKGLFGTDMVLLGTGHPEITMSILQNEELRSKLQGIDIVKLCKGNLKLITYVLNDKELQAKILNPHVVNGMLPDLVNGNIEVAEYLINKNFISLMNPRSLGAIANGNTEIAQYLLDNEKICEEINGDGLEVLGKGNFTVAKRIFEEESFYERLSGRNFAILCHGNFEIAKLIFQNESFCEKLSGSDLPYLASNNIEIALYILESDELSRKLTWGPYEAINTLDNSKIANYIFDNKKYFDLKAWDINNIVTLGMTSSKIALYILTSKDLSIKLDGDSLLKLARCDNKIAKYILENKNLNGKFNGMQLAYLGQNNPQIAKFILDKKNGLLNKIKSPHTSVRPRANFAILCKGNTEITMHVLDKKNALCSEVNTQELADIIFYNNPEIADYIFKNKILSEKIVWSDILKSPNSIISTPRFDKLSLCIYDYCEIKLSYLDDGRLIHGGGTINVLERINLAYEIQEIAKDLKESYFYDTRFIFQ